MADKPHHRSSRRRRRIAIWNRIIKTRSKLVVPCFVIAYSVMGLVLGLLIRISMLTADLQNDVRELNQQVNEIKAKPKASIKLNADGSVTVESNDAESDSDRSNGDRPQDRDMDDDD